MIGSELCRQKTRAPAMAIIGCVNWAATFVIAVAFEHIQVDKRATMYNHFIIPDIYFTYNYKLHNVGPNLSNLQIHFAV